MINLSKNVKVKATAGNKANIKVDINGLFGVLLTIAFIVLKLCGVINWSWIWVLCPMWIDLVIAVIVGVVIWLILNIKK